MPSETEDSTSLCEEEQLLYGELEYMLVEELVSRRRGTRHVGALTGSVVSIVWHFGSESIRGQGLLQVIRLIRSDPVQ